MNNKQNPLFLNRSHIFTAVFSVLFIFLFYKAAQFRLPFPSSLLWAGIIAVALNRLYRKLLSLVRGKAASAASVMTIDAAITDHRRRHCYTDGACVPGCGSLPLDFRFA